MAPKTTFAVMFMALSLAFAMGSTSDAFAGVEQPCDPNIAGFSDEPCQEIPCEQIPSDVNTFNDIPCPEPCQRIPADVANFDSEPCNQETGSIQGKKYEDKNGDGDRDRGEPYLNGWTIFLDENYNQVLDDGEQFAVTATSNAYGKGTYLFEGLPLGTYMVCEVFENNWAQTQPGIPQEPQCYEVTLDYDGEICEGHDFGNVDLGIIEGKKYYDTNLDGDRDRGEPYLNGWTIFLDENENYKLDDGERTTVTQYGPNGKPGYYEFTGVFEGHYNVCEVLQDDWEQTEPGSAHDPMCYEVTIDRSGQKFKNLNFGNYNFKEQGAELVIIKNVINDNGGTAVPSDFTMNVVNPLFEPSTSFAGQSGEGVLIAIDAGLTIVSEDESPLYNGSMDGDCNFTAELGVRYTCTITNDDVTPPVECEEPQVLVGDECVTPPVECEEPQVLVGDECVTPPVECEEPQVLVGDECVTPPVECEEPQVLVGDECVTPPVECEEPQVLVGDECVTPPVECEEPQVLVGDECVTPPVECEEPQVLVGDECVTPPVECEEPQVLVGDECVTPPVECEEPQVLVGDECVTPPVECEEPQVLVGDECVTPPVECEEPQVLVGDECVTPPVECEEPQVLVGDECVTPPVECEEPQVLVGDECVTPPVECEEPQVLVGDECVTPPVECEEPQVLVGDECVITLANNDQGGDEQWDTRPTFGVSHETRETMIVDNGFTFNDNSFTLTDNHHTPFDAQIIEIGAVNTFAATVYADKDLKVQEFLFGVPDVGMGHLAEMRVEVWYDIEGKIDEVKVLQDTEVIDRSSLSITSKIAKCLSTDADDNCNTTTMSAVFLEPLADKVMAIKAIDFALRDQTTYLNDGFDISGDSLNPMETMMIPSSIKGEGLIEVTQNEKYSDYWSTQDGRIFEMNSFGSFKQINQSFERFQDSGKAKTRLHSDFGKLVNYEANRAVKIFDAASLESELPESFSYDFTASERLSPEVLREMIIQEHTAQKVLDAMDQQARWN